MTLCDASHKKRGVQFETYQFELGLDMIWFLLRGGNVSQKKGKLVITMMISCLPTKEEFK